MPYSNAIPVFRKIIVFSIVLLLLLSYTWFSSQKVNLYCVSGRINTLAWSSPELHSDMDRSLYICMNNYSYPFAVFTGNKAATQMELLRVNDSIDVYYYVDPYNTATVNATVRMIGYKGRVIFNGDRTLNILLIAGMLLYLVFIAAAVTAKLRGKIR